MTGVVILRRRSLYCTIYKDLPKCHGNSDRHCKILGIIILLPGSFLGATAVGAKFAALMKIIGIFVVGFAMAQVSARLSNS